VSGDSEGPIGRAHGSARLRARALEFVIVFAAYYIAGKLGQATTQIRSSNLGPVWPAYGIALAAVILRGWRVWPALLAATILVALQSPVSPVTAVAQATGSTLAALAGGTMLRAVKFDPAFSRLKDALVFILLGAGASPLISATLGMAALYAAGVQPYSGIGPAWLIYWLGDGTGALLVTPLVLAAPNLARPPVRARLGEFVALMLVLLAACFVVFGDLPLFSVRLHFLAFAVLPFIIWSAIRFGTIGVAVSTVLVTAFATVETALGRGPFADNSTFIDAFLLDVFFVILAITGLILAAVIAERARAVAEHEKLVAEQAGLEARLRLAAIVESSDEAIVAQDTNGTITDWNAGAERLYGYRPEEAIGKNFFRLVQPDFAGAGLAPDITTKYEALHLKKSGTRFAASVTISPIHDGTGRLIGESAIARDMTERHRAEALREELAHLGRVSLMSALSGALAHEINQPLTAVSVNADAATLLLAQDPLPVEELREALRDIRNDNRRAGEVLQRVRTLLRKETTQFGPVGISLTVGDTVRLVHSSAERRGIRISVAREGEIPPVRGDRVQVQQVLLNLLMNACDAVEHNEPGQRRVSLRTVAGAGSVTVHVEDSGPGIADDELSHIFDPFYSTKNEGLGLGLSICRAIVAAHEGTLEASRNRGRGMTFSVTLPCWGSGTMAESAFKRGQG
jgi:two-component system sensor kinase FixL